MKGFIDSTPFYHDLLTAEGRLSNNVINFLVENLNYDRSVLQSSRWKPLKYGFIPPRFDAIVIYKTVFYRPNILNNDLLFWLELIAHEEWHRQEIGNHFLKALFWYIGYGLEYLRVKMCYHAVKHEIRAYERGFGSDGTPSMMHRLLSSNQWERYYTFERRRPTDFS
jgi:hypothetical protein